MRRTEETRTRLKHWVQALREEDRLKTLTDYAFTFKYGVLRVFCAEVWKEIIESRAEEHGVVIDEFLTYDMLSDVSAEVKRRVNSSL